MDAALARILQERERIRARAEQQRTVVAASVAGLAPALSVIDRVVRTGRYLRSHPAAVGLIVAAVVVLRTRSVIGLVTRGIGTWRVVRRLRALARHLGA